MVLLNVLVAAAIFVIIVDIAFVLFNIAAEASKFVIQAKVESAVIVVAGVGLVKLTSTAVLGESISFLPWVSKRCRNSELFIQ